MTWSYLLSTLYFSCYMHEHALKYRLHLPCFVNKLQYGIWRGYNVAVQHPVMEKGKDRFGDFNENLRNYIDLQSRVVPQLVGFCNVSK